MTILLVKYDVVVERSIDATERYAQQSEAYNKL